MIRTAISALVLTASLASVVPAFAQDDVSIRVSYAGLNLADAPAAAMLERRIDHAVDQICGSAHVTDLNRKALVERCRSQAWSSARGQMQQTIAAARQPQMAVVPKE